MSITEENIARYWKVARQWNTGEIINGVVTVADANKLLNKVITCTHSPESLIHMAVKLQDAIVRNNQGIEVPASPTPKTVEYNGVLYHAS